MSELENLIAREIALHEPATRKNPDALQRLLHPKFTEIGYSGNRYDYDQIITHLSAPTTKDSHQHVIHAQAYQATSLNDDVIMLHYQTAEGSCNDKLGRFAHRLSIWQRTSNSWQLRYHQATPCSAFPIMTDSPL